MRRFKLALINCRFGQPLFYFDEVTSTNDILKEKAEQDAPEGTVVIAGSQTAGRGRRGKKWLSMPGKGVYLSLLLRPHWPATESAFIGFISAVSVARSLTRLNIKGVKLKWPNDILVKGKKIGGVLVEPRISRGSIDFIVVGIGINVSHDQDDFKLLGGDTATSCRLERVRTTCEDVATSLITEFDVCYYTAQRGDKGAILDEWSKRRM